LRLTARSSIGQSIPDPSNSPDGRTVRASQKRKLKSNDVCRFHNAGSCFSGRQRIAVLGKTSPGDKPDFGGFSGKTEKVAANQQSLSELRSLPRP
jgi:hypothetical protein